MSHSTSDSPAALDLFELTKEVGWHNHMHDGQVSTAPLPAFESFESEIERRWQVLPAAKQLPWDQAREAAKDAWDRVLDAVTGGDPAKPSAR